MIILGFNGKNSGIKFILLMLVLLFLNLGCQKKNESTAEDTSYKYGDFILSILNNDEERVKLLLFGKAEPHLVRRKVNVDSKCDEVIFVRGQTVSVFVAAQLNASIFEMIIKGCIESSSMARFYGYRRSDLLVQFWKNNEQKLMAEKHATHNENESILGVILDYLTNKRDLLNSSVELSEKSQSALASNRLHYPQTNFERSSKDSSIHDMQSSHCNSFSRKASQFTFKQFELCLPYVMEQEYLKVKKTIWMTKMDKTVSRKITVQNRRDWLRFQSVFLSGEDPSFHNHYVKFDEYHKSDKLWDTYQIQNELNNNAYGLQWASRAIDLSSLLLKKPEFINVNYGAVVENMRRLKDAAVVFQNRADAYKVDTSKLSRMENDFVLFKSWIVELKAKIRERDIAKKLDKDLKPYERKFNSYDERLIHIQKKGSLEYETIDGDENYNFSWVEKSGQEINEVWIDGAVNIISKLIVNGTWDIVGSGAGQDDVRSVWLGVLRVVLSLEYELTALASNNKINVLGKLASTKQRLTDYSFNMLRIGRSLSYIDTCVDDAVEKTRSIYKHSEQIDFRPLWLKVGDAHLSVIENIILETNPHGLTFEQVVQKFQEDKAAILSGQFK